MYPYWPFSHHELFSLPYPSPSGVSLLTSIDHWQTLIGSFLGTFFAISASVLGYFGRAKWEDYRKWKEALRRIEIRTAMSLGDAFTARRYLRSITATLRTVAKDVKATPPNQFAIQVANLPATGKLYRDETLPELKVKSNYLHNKLIAVEKNLKDMDAILETVKKDHDSLLQRNQFIITLEAGKTTPVPAHQRDAYAADLDGFSNSLEIYSERELPKLILLLEQARLYGRLLGKNFRGTMQKHEPKEDPREVRTGESTHPLSLVDRIDSELMSDVEKDLKLAEERLAQTQEEQTALEKAFSSKIKTEG